MPRRTFLAGGISTIAAMALAGCTPEGAPPPAAAPSGPRFLTPTDAVVGEREAARAASGAVNRVSLTARPGRLDLAGVPADTWSYGQTPAPVIRQARGDRLELELVNDLPEESSIHWHGLALRNDMDGVPHLTQDPVPAGGSFTYDFVTPHAGTYWFHPHSGTQLDRGLYGALIVEDPAEPLAYDSEWVVILDDWLDGVQATPDQVRTDLEGGMGDMGDMPEMHAMGNLLMGAVSDVLGGDAGDVSYPFHLINGRPATDPDVFEATPGDRVRIRLINAAGDTAYRVALTGHRMTVTHTDGFPVDHTEGDTLIIGMGERYDVVVTLGDGLFTLIAEAEGKLRQAHAQVRTGAGTPLPTDLPFPAPELQGKLVTADQLTAAPGVALDQRAPDREITIRLTGGMEKYDWAFDGLPFDMMRPMRNAHPIVEGERVRLTFVNDTEMWHPVHLHGHTYQHAGGGPRKDTSILLPGKRIALDFDADNPGRWLTHCHNLYHGEAQMMGVVAYTA
ncbi:FtsP/CotA-like multicopper oxidase with cupredoxin domain [Myceligenerans xiligouense]|uniref:FtsP/CotA-like multicopper oxidase with cupredoxin domain n=2 Tax=Myceligenerans xiligouense TaxID=253184 RepID=A0A3N4YVS6_9MICO|nr:multicopper oxidase family protein [Myceligenerans xiligouense]RPF22730.1 FtsP/CotA-like multicopper oxidase with cupredoxin domain [Myceligenerans xiligouense]